MVGWTPPAFEVERFSSSRQKQGRLFDFRKMSSSDVEVLKRTVFNVSKDSSYEELRVALENVAVYMVNLLGGYPPKLDHNAYMMHPKGQRSVDGPFVYIDNDRTSWKHRTTMETWDIKNDDPICQLCKFPKSIVDRIYSLHTSKRVRHNATLSHVLLSLSEQMYPDLPNGPLMMASNTTHLDGNVAWIMHCIDGCVKEHGAENVVIPEPWVQEWDWFEYYTRMEQSYYSSTSDRDVKRAVDSGEVMLASELLRPSRNRPIRTPYVFRPARALQ